MASCRCVNHIDKQCLTCGMAFDVCKSRSNTAKYCSYKCSHKGTNNLKIKLTKKLVTIVCNWCHNKFEVENYRKSTAGYCSVKCRATHQKLLYKGENGPYWKGGRTSLVRLLRASTEYKEWRKLVFERDKYTCVFCGDRKSGNMNADHIIPFSALVKNEDYGKMWDTNNGRTLCIPCHKSTETYGNRIGAN